MGTAREVWLAANNGDIGGGEIMQFAIAGALRDLGYPVRMLVPGFGDLAQVSRERDLDTETIGGRSRRDYLLALGRRLRSRPEGSLVWCNGLIPAVAATGIRDRVVHLHRLPDTPAQKALLAVARPRARAVFVPSVYVSRKVPGSQVLLNWTDEIDRCQPRPGGTPTRIGFLGRTTVDKGVHLLAEAVRRIDRSDPGSVRLVLGGEPRFATPEDERLVGPALAAVDHVTDKLGWVNPAEFFAQIDIAAFPSTWEEAFGLVAAEAMASGVPFVVSRAGALLEVAGPEHPWQCAPDDPGDLTDTLVSMLAASPELLASSATAARRRWELNFSPAAGRERVAAAMKTLQAAR